MSWDEAITYIMPVDSPVAEEEEEELVEGAVNVDNEGVETDIETTEVETQE